MKAETIDGYRKFDMKTKAAPSAVNRPPHASLWRTPSRQDHTWQTHSNDSSPDDFRSAHGSHRYSGRRSSGSIQGPHWRTDGGIIRNHSASCDCRSKSWDAQGQVKPVDRWASIGG